jgi:septal ring factor EnvC (AmiA/AmiB activator)
MSRAQRALSVLVVACLGLWGCAQGAANGHANAERIRGLESKIAKLEEDFRAGVAVREQLRKQLTAAEQERSQLGQQVETLQAVAKERDQLRQELANRTGERDGLQSQLDQLRKGIKTLLGQSEATESGNPTHVVSENESQGKS